MEKNSTKLYGELLEKFKQIYVLKNVNNVDARKKSLEDMCTEKLKLGELLISAIPIEGIINEIQMYPHCSIQVIENTQNALQHLLNYAMNLCRKPVRQEYKQIKKYTAYFQYNIEDNFIQSPNMINDILSVMGYKETRTPETVELQRNSSHILNIAFDLFLSTLELKRIASLVKSVSEHGYNTNDALNARIMRSSTRWTEDVILHTLRSEVSRGKVNNNLQSDPGFIPNEDETTHSTYASNGYEQSGSRNFSGVEQYTYHSRPAVLSGTNSPSSSEFLDEECDDEMLYGNDGNSQNVDQSTRYSRMNERGYNELTSQDYFGRTPATIRGSVTRSSRTLPTNETLYAPTAPPIYDAVNTAYNSELYGPLSATVTYSSFTGTHSLTKPEAERKGSWPSSPPHLQEIRHPPHFQPSSTPVGNYRSSDERPMPTLYQS